MTENNRRKIRIVKTPEGVLIWNAKDSACGDDVFTIEDHFIDGKLKPVCVDYAPEKRAEYRLVMDR